MFRMTRRAVVGALGAAPLAIPSLLRAQSSSVPVKLGIISDMSGPFRDAGGPGNRVAAELAVEDIGGSVLGRPIQLMQADCQSSPDVATAIVREWIDRDGVDAIADGGPSSAALGVQRITWDKKRPYLIVGPGSTEFTGKQCSPYGMQFVYDTYAEANSTGRALAKAGGESWFFITADYAFGYSLERDAIATLKAVGGKVVGTTRVPTGTTDYSPFLLQAQASGAQVLALATAGTDLRNCVKQVAEFNLTASGLRVGCLSMQMNDVLSLGLKACAGMVYSDSFYWDMTDATRAWSARFKAKQGSLPTLDHAGSYCATLHWLKAVKATGTTDADAVVAAMKATPINDMYNQDVKIREDGRVMHVMYLWQVKTEAESRYPFDVCKLVARIEPADAWRSLKDGNCPLVKA
jgi:branched-chain amino acid transport system substrate-binding protein